MGSRISLHIWEVRNFRGSASVWERSQKGWDLADYVLGRFAKEEEPVIREALEKVVQACEVMITEDTRTAMNRFNG